MQAGFLAVRDFLNVAILGGVVAVLCVVVALETRRRRAAAGAALSLLPVALLAYFLSASDG